jgi:Replication initiation factor
VFAGIDYLTLWSDSSPEANKSFYQNASDWLVSVTPQASNIKSASLYGTKGIRSEGVYVGIGEERSLLNVPGALAQQAYCKLYNPSHTITRMDIQVTATHGYDRKCPEAPFFNWLVELNTFKPKGKGRPAKATIAGGYGQGWTTYTGKSGSDIMGRIYDKWAQSGDEAYRHAIRWEVQARRQFAEMLAQRFIMLTYDEITSSIPELVQSFYEKRGINPPWRTANPQLWRQPPPQVWDYERSLKWLEQSVSPTIERLLGYVSLQQICAALGIDRYDTGRYPIPQAPGSVARTSDME